MFGQVLPQCLIDDCGIAKHIGEIWFQEDHVRPLLVELVVLATNTPAKVHLRDVVFFNVVSFLTHRIFVHSALRHAP
ncbi:MAG: hypothetical protein QOC81_4738 [Thermoanaerobaculia bacterium]|nr:hypothetical protein [Thermoanaerobaculia bacterium]